MLQNDGSVLASSITCAGLALIDASIHVFDVIIGSSTVRQNIELLVSFPYWAKNVCPPLTYQNPAGKFAYRYYRIHILQKRFGNLRLTDPALHEEEEIINLSAKPKEVDEASCLTIGYLPSSEQISCLLQEGLCNPDILISDINHLKTVSSDLLPNVTKCLVESVKSVDKIKSEK